MVPQMTRVLTFVAIICCAGMLLTIPAHSQTPASTQSEILTAFSKVQSAEQAGGNVTALVADLNQATSLLSEANSTAQSDPAKSAALSSQASAIAAEVGQQAAAVEAYGAANRRLASEFYVLEMGLLVTIAILLYVYLPKIVRRTRFRLHADWRVKKR